MSAQRPDSDLLAQDPTTGEEQPKLHLEVQVEKPEACRRHVVVTIPPEDIQRYIDQVIDELSPKADVPGFRPGRAPRKLIAARFRKEIRQQAKAQLLLDAIQQAIEQEELVPISEPDFDPEAVELPEQGSLTFEFELEVRPEFELPDWKGLKLRRVVREVTDQDIEGMLDRLLADEAELVPTDEPAAPGDYVTVDITFYDGERQIAKTEEETVQLVPVLTFGDATLEGFDKLMEGVRPGDRREATLTISEEAPAAEYRGKQIKAVFEVVDVRRAKRPELTPELLASRFGEDIQSEEELREVIRRNLASRFEYEQRRQLREELTNALLKDADWELPQDLLRRQSQRELERMALELRRSGFTDAEIRVYENRLRQNVLQETARALKEHFILERIAEEEGIDAEPEDFDMEILMIASSSGESPRRVRARLEKSGQMDVLRNQIVERKVIDRILDHAQFEDVPYDGPPLGAVQETGIDFTITAQVAEAEQAEKSSAGEGQAESS